VYKYVVMPNHIQTILIVGAEKNNGRLIIAPTAYPNKKTEVLRNTGGIEDPSLRSG
jgi:hypothetical protein